MSVRKSTARTSSTTFYMDSTTFKMDSFHSDNVTNSAYRNQAKKYLSNGGTAKFVNLRRINGEWKIEELF